MKKMRRDQHTSISILEEIYVAVFELVYVMRGSFPFARKDEEVNSGFKHNFIEKNANIFTCRFSIDFVCRLMHYFLGLEVWQRDGCFLIGQGKLYVLDILKRFRM